MENKVTEREILEMIKAEMSDNEVVVAWCDKMIVAKENKALKAKERAAVKKAEGDALRECIKSVLSKEFMTVEDIFAILDNEELTKAKVIARLTQLVKAGEAVKSEVTTEGKKRMAYALAE